MMALHQIFRHLLPEGLEAQIAKTGLGVDAIDITVPLDLKVSRRDGVRARQVRQMATTFDAPLARVSVRLRRIGR